MDVEERIRQIGRVSDHPEKMTNRQRDVVNYGYRHAPIKNEEWLGEPIVRSPIRRMMRRRFKQRIAQRLAKP